VSHNAVAADDDDDCGDVFYDVRSMRMILLADDGGGCEVTRREVFTAHARGGGMRLNAVTVATGTVTQLLVFLMLRCLMSDDDDRLAINDQL